MNRRQQKKSLKRLIGTNLENMGWNKLPQNFLYNTDHIENMAGITGEYRGRKFTIFDCGHHPCAYVDTTDCMSAVRDRLFIGEVEITFDSDSPGCRRIPFGENGIPFRWFSRSTEYHHSIGWDYNNVVFAGFLSFTAHMIAKKYTMTAILRHVKGVIDEIEDSILV